MSSPLALLALWALVIVLAAVAGLLVRHEPRRVANGALIAAAAILAAVLALVTIARLPLAPERFEQLSMLGALAVGAMLLGLPLLLMLNGVVVVRREGRALAHLLSFAAGTAMLVLPLGVVWLFERNIIVVGAIAFAVAAMSAWLAFAFLAFFAHTLAAAVAGRRAPANAVIALGSGLVDGEVPKLLAGRLERALAEARRRGGPDGPLPIVASGGQGPDEPRAEAAAMAEWLEANGQPADRILVEDRSTTTEENLRFSRDLLEAEGIGSPWLIATSAYHAPRAGMLARDLGIDAQAVGGRTRFYYVPSAYLREFAGVVVAHPWPHLVAAAVAVVIAVLLGIESTAQRP